MRAPQAKKSKGLPSLSFVLLMRSSVRQRPVEDLVVVVERSQAVKAMHPPEGPAFLVRETVHDAAHAAGSGASTVVTHTRHRIRQHRRALIRIRCRAPVGRSREREEGMLGLAHLWTSAMAHMVQGSRST